MVWFGSSSSHSWLVCLSLRIPSTSWLSQPIPGKFIKYFPLSRIFSLAFSLSHNLCNLRIRIQVLKIPFYFEKKYEKTSEKLTFSNCLIFFLKRRTLPCQQFKSDTKIEEDLNGFPLKCVIPNLQIRIQIQNLGRNAGSECGFVYNENGCETLILVTFFFPMI